MNQTTYVYAGIPARNFWLYHQIRFLVGDPAALIILPDGSRNLILRDIEMERAHKRAAVDRVYCPADFAPDTGLSGDRETATAQAVAEFLRRHQVSHVVSDRTLPLLFAHVMHEQGVVSECDIDLGVAQRRSKDADEIKWLQEAQQVTEGAMEMACGLIATADVDAAGGLVRDGQPLTSERVRTAIDIWLLERGFANVPSIVAGGPQGADCHDHGHGPLRTGEPVIVDIFPQCRVTLYNGDCTRTVVHGTIPERVARMHVAVVAAKWAATAACRAGASGEAVHAATAAVIRAHGYEMGLPDESSSDDYCAMVHGTGHGIGLEVHEPPLLDKGGPPLVVGDALTIEPGLYCQEVGGVRVEDMVIVEESGCINLNKLHEGLSWA